MRIFETLIAQDVMDEDQAMQLIRAYTTMRNEIHRRNLLNLDADVVEDKFVAEREWVKQAWNQWFS
ncbi:glutamate-ammonia-ligase adenylyltransferase [Vibrio sp. JCM 18904]|nr:glutamate-ammonia-ligase adenylyltransferase [Vibrio sp. JCM 18904]GAK18388.1 glutamate-ammonia-ligase adenylyltransferase [Vibrio sp. JCM 19053]